MDKELFHNEWLSVKETPDGYVYSHETRCNGKIVAILVYKEDEFLGRFEICAAHSPNIELCAITGGVEKDDPLMTAIHELKEEAGIDAVPEELTDLGTVRPSKSADTVVYLYALFGGNKILGEAKGDGSVGERGSYCKWCPAENIATCKDPLVSTMLIRLFHKKGGMAK